MIDKRNVKLKNPNVKWKTYCLQAAGNGFYIFWYLLKFYLSALRGKESKAMNEESVDSILSLPKAELHVHLEGSISVETLNRLAAKKGLPVFEESPYRFSSFKQFDALFPALGPYFDTPEDFYVIARSFGERLKRENIVYCEVSIMPYVHVQRGIGFKDLMDAVGKAFDELQTDDGPDVRIICAIPRNIGPMAGEKTLDWIGRYPHKRIVGIDLAGEERPGTIRPFAPVFDRAREMGLGTVAHAGEFLGPEAVWETLRELRPHRIGHGISSVKDKRLVEHLVNEGIALDISMTGNVKLGAVSDLAHHPIRMLYQYGVPVTLNTDDPAFFQISLPSEYRILYEDFKFPRNQVQEVIENGFRFRFE